MKIVVFFSDGKGNDYATNEEFDLPGHPRDLTKEQITEEVIRRYPDGWYSYDIWPDKDDMEIINTYEEFTNWKNPYKLNITSANNDVWDWLRGMIKIGNILSNTPNITYSFTKIAVVYQREIILVKFNTGDEVLFYKSIGLGTGMESKDEWVPFPGVTKDGWFIKESRHNKIDKYNVPIFQQIAKELKSI